eukprot:g3301.t1
MESSSGSSRPRLKLAPRTRPVTLGEAFGKRTVASSSSSRPSPFGAAKPVDIASRKKSDPFGSAKPADTTRPREKKFNPFGSAKPVDTTRTREKKFNPFGGAKTVDTTRPREKKINPFGSAKPVDTNARPQIRILKRENKKVDPFGSAKPVDVERCARERAAKKLEEEKAAAAAAAAAEKREDEDSRKENVERNDDEDDEDEEHDLAEMRATSVVPGDRSSTSRPKGYVAASTADAALDDDAEWETADRKKRTSKKKSKKIGDASSSRFKNKKKKKRRNRVRRDDDAADGEDDNAGDESSRRRRSPSGRRPSPQNTRWTREEETADDEARNANVFDRTRPRPRNSRWTEERRETRRRDAGEEEDEKLTPPQPLNSRWTEERRETRRRDAEEEEEEELTPPQPLNSRWTEERRVTRRRDADDEEEKLTPPQPLNSRWSSGGGGVTRRKDAEEEKLTPPQPLNSRWSSGGGGGARTVAAAADIAAPAPAEKTEKELELDRRIARIRAARSKAVKTDMFGRPIVAKSAAATKEDKKSEVVVAAAPATKMPPTAKRVYFDGAFEHAAYPDDADRSFLDRKTKALLNEYFCIHDTNEALLCMEELKCPAHYPAVVASALSVALESFKQSVAESTRKLLVAMRVKLIPSFVVAKELNRCVEMMDDIKVDNPKAPSIFRELAIPLVVEDKAVRAIDLEPAIVEMIGDPALYMRSVLEAASRAAEGDVASLLEKEDEDDEESTLRFVPFDEDKHGADLMRVFKGASKGVQRRAVDELQRFCHTRNFRPEGLCEAVFMSAYDQEILEEDAYFAWADKKEDGGESVPGRLQARKETLSWLTWLKEDGGDSDDSDDEEEE